MMVMGNNLSGLTTEQRNLKTMNIDQYSTKQILAVMNEEDQTVALSVQQALSNIELATEMVYQSLQTGGRLYYVGAGTSGRLGVIDAAECPPTFRTDPEMVKGIIAGGKVALFHAVEGAEDDWEAGMSDLKNERVSKKDVVIGITASGRTPYVIGAVSYANSIGAKTISLTCNEKSELGEAAKISIETLVGPEVLTGSTRLKAASAHKMVLNMISTAVMIKLGKVYENLMVDLKASNYKLEERAKRIVSAITEVSEDQVDKVLLDANQDVKVAIVMVKADVNVDEAKRMLSEKGGLVRQAIERFEEEI